MDPLATWGVIIALITGAGSASAFGTWRTIGRVEGKTDRFAERLALHSGKIDEHERLLVTLPGDVATIKTDLEKLTKTVNRILDDVEGRGPHGGRSTTRDS